MSGSAEMKLVFRLAGIGFTLPVNLLVEIVELESSPRMSRKKETSPFPLSAFRGEEIPVVNVAGRFGLSSASESAVTMAVLYGELGHWGMLLDEVVGIRPAGEFSELSLSPLFSLGDTTLYDKIDVWRAEPLVRFEPDRFAPQGDPS